MTAQILKGFSSEEIVQNGYDKLKTFGVGAGTTLKHWHDYLLQMLHLGYIEIAYNEGNHLKVTESGNAVLFGRVRAELALPINKEPEKPTRTAKTTGKQKYGKDKNFSTESDANEDLLEVLRTVRKQIADENNWPAYVVLSDKTLREIVSTPPLSIDDLHHVYGFGEKKIEMFGQRFVDAVNEYLKR